MDESGEIMQEYGTGLAPEVWAAAEGLEVGSAPVAAILADGRARGRRRTVGATALGVVAAGAAVAVGLTQAGSGRPASALGQGPASGPGTTGPLAAPFAATSPGHAPGAAVGGQAPGQAPGRAPTSAPTDPFSGDYGTTTVASGPLGGTTWQLTRVISPGTPNEHTPFPCQKDQGSYVLHQDLYVVTPDGVRVGADLGDSLTCSTAQAEGTPWDHTPQFRISPLVSARYVQIDTKSKEESSRYGSVLIGLIDQTRIAKVQLKFDDGRPTATAQLVPAPAPENGTYFYFALPDKDWNQDKLPGKLEYLDAAGHQVQLPGWQTH